MNFSSKEIKNLIKRSLKEDIGSGDHSSLSSIPKQKRGNARMIFKENAVIAGLELSKLIFHEIDKNLEVKLLKKDGEKAIKGDIVLTVHGFVHSILAAERTVLNFIQHLSGIATLTNKISNLIIDSDCKILDTRKTTPGLRKLEKWAVKTGGGHNHRIGLYDMIMLKDNHVDFAGGITKAVKSTEKYLSEKNLKLKIEVETRNLKEVEEAVNLKSVDRIMFDNFTPQKIKQALHIVKKTKETEASGGITIENIRDYAATGVDFISIGALTHSVKSIDISLKQY
ncbi:MAG: carboxylating nicotinate-nucleotide diphosphorylase [Bacteroidetes bacterium]|nr:carboxylating nicotinate-nucleotide diphosphorylase [Bacteroidota bacterium]